MPSGHIFVVDISRHIGEAEQLVSAVLRQMQPYSGSTSLWYVRANQASPPGLSTLPRVNAEPPATTICNHIHQNSANGSVFHVLSYDPVVLRAASDLNSDSAIVIPTHIRSFAYPDGGTAPRPSTTEGSPNSSDAPPLSHEEGVELAKQILRNGNYTSQDTPLLQSRLRSKMGPRARKDQLNPSSAFLIKNHRSGRSSQGLVKARGGLRVRDYLVDGRDVGTTGEIPAHTRVAKGAGRAAEARASETPNASRSNGSLFAEQRYRVTSGSATTVF
jgi:hypothetical protein